MAENRAGLTAVYDKKISDLQARAGWEKEGLLQLELLRKLPKEYKIKLDGKTTIVEGLESLNALPNKQLQVLLTTSQIHY